MIGKSGKEVLPFTCKLDEFTTKNKLGLHHYFVCFLGKRIGASTLLQIARRDMRRCNAGYKRIVKDILQYDGVRAHMAERVK